MMRRRLGFSCVKASSLFTVLASVSTISCNNSPTACEYSVYGADSIYHVYCISCHALNTYSEAPNQLNIDSLHKLSHNEIIKAIKNDSIHIGFSKRIDSCSIEHIVRYIKEYTKTKM